VQYVGDPTFTLYPLGDIHIGTIHCDMSRLRTDVEKIKNDPYGLWIGMGDYCECITLDDSKRFCASEIHKDFINKLDTIAVAQNEAFIDEVWDIRDKSLGLLSGNHEGNNKKRHFVDIVGNACQRMTYSDASDAPQNYVTVFGNNEPKMPYLGDTAMVRLVFERVDDDGKHERSHNVVIYAEHGHGGGRKTGGKINSLEDMMGPFDADIYLRGHVHTKLVTKHPRLSIAASGSAKLQSKTRVCGLTGCYYKTYQQDTSSYGERNGYSPTELGGIAIRIRPGTGEMETVN
jgi:predicted phosphodiesterase